MTWTTTIAAVVAALASAALIVFAIAQRREDRRRRLTEVGDLVDEIRTSVEWGSPVPLREAMQKKLQTRPLEDLDLPGVEELMYAALRSSDGDSLALADKAAAEVRQALKKRRRLFGH